MQEFIKNYKLNDNMGQEDYADFGKFLCIYNKDVESYHGSFNWNSSDFVAFCKRNGIIQKGTRSKIRQENHFWFDADRPSNVSTKDIAHNFLRHIRNAFAHGNIEVKREKRSQKYYIIKDFSKAKKQTMSGKIRSDLLWNMIHILLAKK